LEQKPVEPEANIHPLSPPPNTEVYSKGESTGEIHRRTDTGGAEGSRGMVQRFI